MTTAFALPRRLVGAIPIPAGAAAWALAVAGGAHLAALPAHRGEGIAVSGFFLAAAILQVAAATTILRGAGASVRAVIVLGNVSMLALWAWSRTVGVPIGAHSGLPEHVGPLDVTAVVAQAIAIGAVLVLSRTRSRASLVRPRLGLVVVVLLVALGGARLQPASHQDENHEPGSPIAAADHAPTDPPSIDGTAADHDPGLKHPDPHPQP